MTITVNEAVLSALSIQVSNAQQELYQLRLAITSLLIGTEETDVSSSCDDLQALHDIIAEREAMAVEEEECMT